MGFGPDRYAGHPLPPSFARVKLKRIQKPLVAVVPRLFPTDVGEDLKLEIPLDDRGDDLRARRRSHERKQRGGVLFRDDLPVDVGVFLIRSVHHAAERVDIHGHPDPQIAETGGCLSSLQFLGEQDFQEPIRVQLILCPLRNGGKGTDIMPRRRESPAP